MAFVTRYQIQDLCGRFWTGADFSRDEASAEEYRDEAEAIEIANEVDGEVVRYDRFDAIGDLPRLPEHFRHAAE